MADPRSIDPVELVLSCVKSYDTEAAACSLAPVMTRTTAVLTLQNGLENQVTPGGTRTPIWARFAPTDEALAALEHRIARSVPLGRPGEADEVAKAVLYLASDDASNVTGTEIVVDGGATGAPQGASTFRAA